MKQYALTLDLQDDPALISEYGEHHRQVWPEVLASIKEAGILHMELYRWGNRLFMMIEVEKGFSFGKKAAQDATNSKVQEWVELM